MRAWVLAAFTIVALVGCRKKPSPEFAEAEARYQKLYAEKIDDAFGDPEMQQIEGLLIRVPKNSRDHVAAQQLLERIRSERERVAREEAARKEAIRQALEPVPMPPSTRAADQPPASAPGASPDAGIAMPIVGMPVDELRDRFSRCFATREPIEVMGKGRLETWEMKNLGICRELFPQMQDVLLLVDAGKIVSKLDSRNLDWRLPDGGVAPR